MPFRSPEGATAPPLGRHCLLELYDCAGARLDDVEFARAAMVEAACRAGVTVLQVVAHRFEPNGVTAVALLAESHLAIHTWPGHGFAAIDVFTCGTRTDPEAACRYLVEAYEPASHSYRQETRGSSRPAG